MSMKRKRLFLLRIILGILIVLNMALIFWFSAESGQQSSKTSGIVAQKAAEVTVPDYHRKPVEEQKEIVKQYAYDFYGNKELIKTYK